MAQAQKIWDTSNNLIANGSKDNCSSIYQYGIVTCVQRGNCKSWTLTVVAMMERGKEERIKGSNGSGWLCNEVKMGCWYGEDKKSKEWWRRNKESSRKQVCYLKFLDFLPSTCSPYSDINSTCYAFLTKVCSRISLGKLLSISMD